MKTNSYPLILKKKVVEFKINNKGVNVSIISCIFGISRSTIFNWCKLFKDNKLTEKKTYKRISKITPIIKNYIQSYVCSRVIFFYKNLLALIKRKYNTIISKSSLYRILNDLKITRKKIKKKMVLRSKKDHSKQIKSFKKIIKTMNKNNIISVDETSIDTHISADYGWSKKGDNINETKKTKRIRYTVISAISNNNVIYNKYIKGSANAETFLQFIKELKKRIINDSYILLDNARIHHSKIVNKYIKENNINFIFNVPYCPEFNPIEKVFSQIKHILKTKKNNQKELLTNIKKSFNKVTGNNLYNYYKKSLEF